MVCHLFCGSRTSAVQTQVHTAVCLSAAAVIASLRKESGQCPRSLNREGLALCSKKKMDGRSSRSRRTNRAALWDGTQTLASGTVRWWARTGDRETSAGSSSQ